VRREEAKHLRLGGRVGEEEAWEGGRERKRRVSTVTRVGGRGRGVSVQSQRWRERKSTVTRVGGRGRGVSVQSQRWEGEKEACQYSHKGGRERKRRVGTVTKVGGRGRGV
jgi:hypothetical protein